MMQENVAAMPHAAFCIDAYKFDKVQIDLSSEISSQLSLSFEPHGVFDSTTSLFNLLFVVRVFSEQHTEPFISVRCNSFFKFDQPITLTAIPDYFYQNSIAILFPYVRAYISMVTSQSTEGGIMLPTLNLSSLADTLKRNTIQK